ncbi:hypothetical protein [Ancylobacter mangrovi]|uniref:Uncharacterized protein n=1 Tax=Ancylobacter mangrovi TaxID=2972472 RepID=A0A9X2PCQ0_9HYPH|nr:hypothetical protein [Ancylobacter mangrovi]MCS0493545.1 hypothetical protein [Ancylobacter mangrovi]MCS0501837.1 hypothetical protein [Ancylobacter mangrovi]
MSAMHSELPGLLKNLTALIEASKYTEAAEAYAAFVKEHPTTRFLASEPVPFKLGDHFAKKFGSSATSTFTLQHITWAEDVKKALNEGPAAFAELATRDEGRVAEIAKTVKKVA